MTDRTASQVDSLHVETTDRARVLGALERSAARAGMIRVPPEELLPHGRWLHGEEDPAVRRFLVAPPGERWTTVLPSATDWEQESCTELAADLDCRVAYLMLHDGDVFTLHLRDGTRLIADYLSSPEYFDLPPRPPGDLGLDPACILPFCRPGATTEDIRRALSPAGRVDVDGREAFERTMRLLRLPAGPPRSYALALREDGITPSEDLRDHVHVTYRLAADLEAERLESEEVESEDDADVSEETSDPDEDRGVVLPFRPRE